MQALFSHGLAKVHHDSALRVVIFHILWNDRQEHTFLTGLLCNPKNVQWQWTHAVSLICWCKAET